MLKVNLSAPDHISPQEMFMQLTATERDRPHPFKSARKPSPEGVIVLRVQDEEIDESLNVIHDRLVDYKGFLHCVVQVSESDTDSDKAVSA